MRRFLVVLTLAGAALAQSPASDGKVRQIPADELKQILEKKDNLFFLDVREPKELEELGTVKGYVNIPLNQLEGRLAEVPHDKVIVTACNRGVRAARAADILTKNGFKTLGACGLSEWREKKYPLIYPKASEKK